MSSYSSGGIALPKIGASFYYNRAVGTSVLTVLAPASNTNGLWLRSFICPNGVNGDANPMLFADTSAPLGYSDTTKRPIAQHAMGSPSYPQIFIPAGLGLYLVANSSGLVCSLTWDALP